MPEVVNAKITDYSMHLIEPSRPPSRGGNTKALHVHVLSIGDQTFSFLSLGSQQWVYKADTVSFAWELNSKRGRNEIDTDTLVTLDKNGKRVVRGNRGYKRTLRTAPARVPNDRRY